MAERNGRRVFIVGPRKIQNHLLASYVRDEAGIDCTVSSTLEEAQGALARDASAQKLMLRDCPGLNTRTVRQQLLGRQQEFLSPDGIIAIFNVPQGTDFERETISLGVRGFFYTGDAPEILLKGIRALFDGELWISRRAMTDYLIHARPAAAGGLNGNSSGLSSREAEVLATIAAGASNEDVAARLCISPHTVKTHVYRIFRKIGVSNRLEAALWAAKNL